jgi:hypothetical protein
MYYVTRVLSDDVSTWHFSSKKKAEAFVERNIKKFASEASELEETEDAFSGIKHWRCVDLYLQLGKAVAEK